MAERIVGIAAIDYVLGLAVAFEMLLVNVIRDHPGRIVGFIADGPGAGRRAPVVAAEPDRKSVKDRGMRADDRVRLFRPEPFRMAWLGVRGVREFGLAN